MKGLIANIWEMKLMMWIETKCYTNIKQKTYQNIYHYF